jgi:hypothetical protein
MNSNSRFGFIFTTLAICSGICGIAVTGHHLDWLHDRVLGIKVMSNDLTGVLAPRWPIASEPLAPIGSMRAVNEVFDPPLPRPRPVSRETVTQRPKPKAKPMNIEPHPYFE